MIWSCRNIRNYRNMMRHQIRIEKWNKTLKCKLNLSHQVAKTTVSYRCLRKNKWIKNIISTMPYCSRWRNKLRALIGNPRHMSTNQIARIEMNAGSPGTPNQFQISINSNKAILCSWTPPILKVWWNKLPKPIK